MRHPARALGTLGVLATLLFGPGLYQLATLSLRQHRLDRQLAVLEAERARLLAEQERLQSDPTYVEGLIRSTFKVARPGELVIPLETSPSDASIADH